MRFVDARFFVTVLEDWARKRLRTKKAFSLPLAFEDRFLFPGLDFVRIGVKVGRSAIQPVIFTLYLKIGRLRTWRMAQGYKSLLKMGSENIA